jgi:hypothetical protein
VSIAVAGQNAGTLPVRFAPMSEDTVVVMFTDKVAACGVLEGAIARASTSTATSADGPPTSDTPMAIALSGRFQNPTTAEGILRLPVIDAPTEAELKSPPFPLLLRLLLSSAHSFHVTIEVENSILRFAIVNGSGVRAMTPFNTLGRSLAAPTGSYVVEPLGEKVTYKVKGTSKDLLTEVLRGLISRLSYDELPRPFAAQTKMTPFVPPDRNRALDAIAFTGTQLRLQKGFLNGGHTFADVLASPAGARAVWETIYLLQIFRALEWREPETTNKSDKKRTPAESFLADTQGRNHFEVLGVHWSISPKLLEPAHRALRERWSPQGALGKADPAAAKKILERLDEAFAVLQKTTDRQRYRREVVKVKWSQQAEMMLDHAKLAIYRKSYQDAQETLEGLLDFMPSPEAENLVRQLAKARNGGKADD